MTRILDNLSDETTMATYARTMFKSFDRLDVATGYFNLRGWSLLCDIVDAKMAADRTIPAARILIGMVQGSAHQEVIAAYQREIEGNDDNTADRETALQRRKALLEVLRGQLMRGIPTAAAPQAQPDLFTNLPLAEGRISVGKLHLGSSSLPWKPTPKVPESPDPALESGYTTQMFAALAEHLGTPVADISDLPDRYRKAFARQRGHFWDAEGVRRNLRDLIPAGEQEFSAMKEDLFDGVVEICEADYDDGYLRMNATLSKAADFALNGSVIVKFPSMVRATHKKGMCHMLVDDDQLHWVVCRDD